MTADQQCDLLVALRHDTCEAAEKCEPCKGLRQMAITEIERLRRELETQIHREKHAKCLRCGHGLFETTLPESP